MIALSDYNYFLRIQALVTTGTLQWNAAHGQVAMGFISSRSVVERDTFDFWERKGERTFFWRIDTILP